MAINAHRSLILYVFAFLWLLIALSPAYGRGRQDPDLSRADQLINEKEYDQAIMLLSDFSRRNPDQFELAQQRLRIIYNVRDEFNRTADELIDVMINDPDNSEKIYSLTLHLSTLENENSPLMVNFVAGVQMLAQFNIYRNQLRSILERGREHLDRDDHVAAIQVYSTGLDIMRDEFYAFGFGRDIESAVTHERGNVDSMLATFQQDSSNMERYTQQLINTINQGNLAGTLYSMSYMTNAMDRYIGQKQNLYLSVSIFDRILEEIRNAYPETGDRNHLSFVSRIIHGRAGEEIQEGMLGAFDVLWRNTFTSLINSITLNIETLNSEALLLLSSGNYADIVSSLGGIENYLNISTQLFDNQRLYYEDISPRTVQMYGDTLLFDDVFSYLKIKSISEANFLLHQAASISARQSVDRSSTAHLQNGNINIEESLNMEQQARNIIAGMQRDLENIKDRAIQTDAEISSYYNFPYIRSAIDAIDFMSAVFVAQELDAAKRYYSSANTDLERSLAARRVELESGRTLLEGQSRIDDGVVTIFRYPDEALEELNAMLSVLSGDLDRGNSILMQLRNEPSAMAANSEIAALQSDSQALVNELISLRTQGLSLSETARNRMNLAEALRQEGERFISEAQSAYQRQDYDAARENIRRAEERLISSLELQESSSIREMWDNELVSLSLAIVLAENEMIIAEVRTLINSARNMYFDGDFQQAENTLIRARNRWLLTNAEDNQEVLYWLGMVSGGMSARSERVILPTAPLYPEMSQLLSQAQRNYEEGVRFINTGLRDQGIEKFNEAILLTREVRLMYPVNQEAGILELRIEQFTDPGAFNAAFDQRIRTAIAGTRNRSIEAYADLQNLAEINPNYPGLRGIMLQAEYDMGRRLPPPNPANIARSRELTASANRILNENIATQYPVALGWIDEAIQLDPNNNEATIVKDRLQIRMNLPNTIVLSIEDENEYQQAMRETQAGNHLVALARVERILRNPNNRNVQKVLDLERRIRANL